MEKDIERLRKLYGTDEAFFLLAVVSYIEKYCQEKMKGYEYQDFYDLMWAFKNSHVMNLRSGAMASGTDAAESLAVIPEFTLNVVCKKINDLHYQTNFVRHSFDSMSQAEVFAGITNFKAFAEAFNLPDREGINSLWNETEWRNRVSDAATAKRLTDLLDEIRQLKSSNLTLNEDLKRYSSLEKSLEEKNKRIKELLEQQEEDGAGKEELQKMLDQVKAEKEGLLKEIGDLKDQVRYSESLRRVISYTRTRNEFEQRTLIPTENQQSIIDHIDFKGIFLVRGSAGTGKSLVLIKVIENLGKQNLINDSNLRLLTFGKSIKKYNEYLYSKLDLGVDLSNAILTADSFIWSLMRPLNAFINYKDTVFDDEIETISLRDCPLDLEAFKKEVFTFILPNLMVKEQYCDAKGTERTGMKKPLTEEQRAKVWEKFEELLELLEKNRCCKSEYVLYRISMKIRAGELTVPEEKKTDYIIIDEVQDLTPAKLVILKSAARKPLVMAGDSDQTILLPGFEWKYAGISVQGRTRHLHTNFRNTEQLNRIAERYRATIPGKVQENRPESFRLGPDPEIYTVTGKKEAIENIVDSVAYCINTLGYEPASICIITNNNTFSKDDVENRLGNAVREKTNGNVKLGNVHDEDFDFNDKDTIRMSTLHNAKGMDFPVVLYYIDDEYHPAKDFEDSVKDKINRNVIYTAITRSIDFLRVFVYHNADFKAVQDLEAAFREDLNNE